MTSNQYLMLLNPREWAKQTLDSVRGGWPIPEIVVTRALEISGDIPPNRPVHEEPDDE